ncbi:PilZ domain-containing protein [Blastomonas aquatica]|uniref:PilZ domain-containing protein n=1 Tax=Blastomonas aquatica TaxID=1510276 RepID=A0ABQ1JVG1_9SPHN|nr:PilZ domain-containing protein [Blastomonas aquatica]GGB75554.1 hypothetical protein GCM10010833_33470 [Blastomonas aquatica]
MPKLQNQSANDLARYQRLSHRHRLTLTLSGRDSQQDTIEFVVENLSDGGFSFQSDRSLEVGTVFVVELPATAPVEAEVVWADSQRHGCRFHEKLTSAQLAAARLKAEPAIPVPAFVDSIDTSEAKYPKQIRTIILAACAVVPWAVAYALFINRP